MHLRHLGRKLADRKQTEGRRRPGASRVQRGGQALSAGLREKAVPCTAMSTWVRGRMSRGQGPGWAWRPSTPRTGADHWTKAPLPTSEAPRGGGRGLGDNARDKGRGVGGGPGAGFMASALTPAEKPASLGISESPATSLGVGRPG